MDDLAEEIPVLLRWAEKHLREWTHASHYPEW